MTKGVGKPLIMAVALLLWWVVAGSCAEQPPDAESASGTAIPTATPTRRVTNQKYAKPAARQAVRSQPTSKPEARKARQVTDSMLSSLPSSVSFEISSFASQGGRQLQPAPRPLSTRAGEMQSSGDLPPPLPPPLSTMPGRNVATETAPSPLSTPLGLKAAPFARTDVRFPINLGTALKLSDARPLIVAAAQARVWVAEAELTRAKLLWVPTLNIAFDYIRHDGGGPDFNKGIMTYPSVNFFYGGVGLGGYLPLTDAVYEPLVARQLLNARQWDIQSAKNDALMQTAEAYFMVHQYRGIYAGAVYVVERGRDIVGRIVGLSRDLVSAFEVDRARNMLADLEQQAVAARQQWRVHSARLTRVLRLDPRTVVEPLEHDHLQVTLIDPALLLDDLMPIALTNRPELASRHAMVEAAVAGIRREKARPFLPIVILTGYQTPGGMLLQAGFFGIGPNSSLNQWVGREDVSIQFIWQLESLGIGNLARIKAQRGQQSRAIVDLRRTQDTVAEEVTEAHANLQSAAVRVVQADRALRTGIITLNGSTEGLEQTNRFGDVLQEITRPQEAIYALQLLMRAFTEYYTTVAEYNRAQFELFHALGYPAREVACLRSPGDAVPVDTSRPIYLPRVGDGPPPATR